ncbi:diguanylate cyclase [Sulfurimonas sp. HSL-1656]|uniref:diguanylate cyclase n=1 Tax=Thiomicrolovo subterrani TaxID=3131934 RepID=UPI0031F7995F
MIKSNISLFEGVLHRAFDRFYEDLIKNAYVEEFLKGVDLARLKQSQLSSFLEAVYDEDEAFFARFKQLGLFHFKMGLPYVEYRGAFDTLYAFLIEELEEVNDITGLPDAIELYIRRAINASAAGYLEPNLDNDQKTLERQIKQQIGIPAVKEHLEWILEVIKDIRLMNPEARIEFDEHRCMCGSWLHSEELIKFIPDAMVRKDMLDTHREIHLITKNIYRSIRREDYHKIFIDYVMLVRQSMYLYNELNINVTQQTLIDDVSKDALTGLLNRRDLMEILSSEIRLHGLIGSLFCVVMFDLDHFKAVNDTCGHQDGDAVIVGMAQTLSAHLRKTDHIFRYGGEEFLAILPGTTAKEAFAICEKIRKAFEVHTWEGCVITTPVTVSIGIAEYSERLRDNPRHLVFEADMNLYSAKQLGRNRTVM